MTRGIRFQCAPLLLLLFFCVRISAEQLPIKTYTIADGLARDTVTCIVHDSHGFMWFCTPDGLSRFDGYGFTNYGPAQGLPHRHVNDLLETRAGLYWIATDDGLCLFNPRGVEGNAATANTAPKFLVYRPDGVKESWSVNTLMEDQAGTIWCGTDRGPYRLVQTNQSWTLQAVDIGIGRQRNEETNVRRIVADHYGALWIATNSNLYRYLPDGRTEHYTTQQGLPQNAVSALLEDHDARMWIGTPQGLCRIVAEPSLNQNIVERLYTTRDGLPHDRIGQLFQSRDGTLWLGIALVGLTAFNPAETPSPQSLHTFTPANGLSDKDVTALAEDRDGNLWVGTGSGGAMKITRHGFTTYGETDGISQTRIGEILEDQAGELCVIGALPDRLFIDRFDGHRFRETVPNMPAGTPFSWGWYQIILQDHLGEWWVATSRGVARFPHVVHPEQLAHVSPKAIYTSADGLNGDEVFRLFEDSRGDIWIGTIAPGLNFLTRWERATGTFHRYLPQADGIPAKPPTAIQEDGGGDVWIGLYGLGLARYRAGRFNMFGTAAVRQEDNVVRGFYLDHAGRLWAATSLSGLVRIDDPTAEEPHLITYTTAEGLSTNTVTCVTEDQWGHIYVGTGRGLDRLDPATGHVKHYTTADGLADNFINVALRARDGALWFGTLLGLSRLIPEPDAAVAPPPILLSGLRIAGVAQPISDLGETQVGRLELAANQNQMQADFLSPNFRSGEVLRYQYMLEGADRDWGPPTLQRSIIYANLRPGSYRFKVRALNTEGLPSQTPATIAFSILPPLWQRWWFLTAAVLLAGGAAFLMYRYRVSQLLELERVRTRIASDLHDDIGASLSRMAILSEVVKRDGATMRQESLARLSDIAETSRGLVDSMSDIVWAIDPRRDDLHSVILRVRQFAADLLEANSIRWELKSAAEFDRIKLTPEQRRHLFLIFKEALTNIARHSGCENVSMSIAIFGDHLRAEIHDDGRGFDIHPAGTIDEHARGGHGLENMRVRARQLGGQLDISSSPGAGAKITLTIPVYERTGMNMLFARFRK